MILRVKAKLSWQNVGYKSSPKMAFIVKFQQVLVKIHKMFFVTVNENIYIKKNHPQCSVKQRGKCWDSVARDEGEGLLHAHRNQEEAISTNNYQCLETCLLIIGLC